MVKYFRKNSKILLTITFIEYSIYFLFATLILLCEGVTGEIIFFLHIQFLLYIFYVFCIVFFFNLTREFTSKKFKFSIFVTAFVLRSLFVIIIYFILINFRGGPFQYGWQIKDDWTYHEVARILSTEDKINFSYITKIKNSVGIEYSLYPIFLAVLFKVFSSTSIFIGRFANAFLNSLTIVIFYKFLREVGIEDYVAKLSSILFKGLTAVIHCVC